MYTHRQRLSHYQVACRIKQESNDEDDDKVISAIIKDKVKSNRDRTAILKEKQHLKALGFTQEEINQFLNQSINQSIKEPNNAIRSHGPSGCP